MTTPTYSVVIVGAGPTGLLMAHLLGLYGISTCLIERADATVGEARAVSIDDESLRALQGVGMIDEVLSRITQGYGVEYYSWTQRLFARIDPTRVDYGWQKRNAFRQQVLAQQLAEGLARYPHVHLKFEHELQSFQQDEHGVTLHLLVQGQSKTWTCQWLVACDGGRSEVREALQIELEGNTFGERWLIADMLGRTLPFRHTRTYCDPERPAIRLPGPDATVRYEFMLREHESADWALDESRFRAWIAQREPSDAGLQLARKVVYTFHARVAQRWQQGRVFLAGDAAHLTPPFAGQGMNSGLRDAANLAWKLAAVVKGELPTTLLQTYETERKPHAWSLIQMALRIGRFMQPKSTWDAAFHQTLLRFVCLWPAARDYITQLRFKPKPKFFKGFFLPPTTAGLAVTAGQLLPQPRVELAGGQLCLLDDVLGSGFAVVRWAGSAPVHIPEIASVQQIELIRYADDFLTSPPSGHIQVRDRENVLGPILDSAHATAMVIRPDRYVFAFISGDANASPVVPLSAALSH